jgi:hypothetical protein
LAQSTPESTPLLFLGYLTAFSMPKKREFTVITSQKAGNKLIDFCPLQTSQGNHRMLQVSATNISEEKP